MLVFETLKNKKSDFMNSNTCARDYTVYLKVLKTMKMNYIGAFREIEVGGGPHAFKYIS